MASYLIAPTRKQYLTSHVRPSGPSDELVCPVCYDAWDADNQPIVQAICSTKHVFHKACLEGWFDCGGNTCPTCRAECFWPQVPTPEPAPPSPPRTYGHTPFGHDADLEEVEARRAEYDYEAYVRQIEGMIAPLMDQDEVFEQFNIDLEDEADHSRFHRGLTAILASSLALCRFPPNLREGWMPQLASHLRDWDTIKCLIATLYIQAYGPLMSCRQWMGMLIERDGLYRVARRSADFGTDTQAWLDHIAHRADTRYELSVCDDWLAGALGELHWFMVDARGIPISEERWIYLVPGQARSHYDFVEFGGGDKPVLSFDGSSVWVNASVIGKIAGMSANRDGSISLRNDARQHMVFTVVPACEV